MSTAHAGGAVRLAARLSTQGATGSLPASAHVGRYPVIHLRTSRRWHPPLKRWLSTWPVDRPRNWLAQVNQPMDEPSLQMIRQSVARAMPLGTERWRIRVAARLGLNTTLQPRGRPRKDPKKSP